MAPAAYHDGVLYIAINNGAQLAFSEERARCGRDGRDRLVAGNPSRRA